MKKIKPFLTNIKSCLLTLWQKITSFLVSSIYLLNKGDDEMNTENSRFAKAYTEVVKKYLDELSEKMNSKGREYEQNLESLKQLINTGKTDKRLVEQLNHHLVEELRRIPLSESKMVIDIEKAKPDEFNQLVGQLQHMINKGI